VSKDSDYQNGLDFKKLPKPVKAVIERHCNGKKHNRGPEGFFLDNVILPFILFQHNPTEKKNGDIQSIQYLTEFVTRHPNGKMLCRKLIEDLRANPNYFKQVFKTAKGKAFLHQTFQQ